MNIEFPVEPSPCQPAGIMGDRAIPRCPHCQEGVTTRINLRLRGCLHCRRISEIAWAPGKTEIGTAVEVWRCQVVSRG